MSFRKRNIVISSQKHPPVSTKSTEKDPVTGTRPSPLDGRLTTSSGTRSLDALLAGHAGLALGTLLMIEESGTTDFGGILLRYFAAEGVIQGHQVHVLGVDETWGRELPGLSGVADGASSLIDEKGIAGDRMKIAWRYERLGGVGRDKAPVPVLATASANASEQQVFCHDFDLSKRLALPSPSVLNCIPQTPKISAGLEARGKEKSPFFSFMRNLTSQLSTTPQSTIHRIVIPSLLSPAIYPNIASAPEYILQFLHSLRALLRTYPTRATALITLPLTLYPRGTGLTRWAEILSDGVIELAPFPTQLNSAPIASSSSVTGQEETPQGILKVHRLPVLHEKGCGGGESSGFGDDLAFTLSRRKGLVIKPFSLPPVDGDTDAHYAEIEGNSGRAAKLNIEF